MQLDDYHYGYDPGLAGFSLKKLGRKLKKVVKKVVKPALHIGAAVVTGGSSLALSARMLQAKQERKAQEKMQKQMIAAQAAPFEPVTQLAPTANSVMTRLPAPTYTYDTGGGASFAPGGGGGFYPTVQPQQTQQMPPWVVPAAVAGGAVVLLSLMNRGSRQ